MFIEQYTDAETQVLDRYFTNTDLPVFCVVNLPEATKAALFARYSRTGKSLRRLFLDEFYEGETVIAPDDAGTVRSDTLLARVLDEYGDDSVAQLGGAHIACEGVSNILTKVIERPRLAAYLEQSTRYINFADKPGGKYRYAAPFGFHIDSSGLSFQYRQHMDQTFAGYAKMVAATTAHLFDKLIVSRTETFEDGEKQTIERAIRAEALDACRGLLPAGTTSNLGMYASGQSYEALITRMLASDLGEARYYGSMMLDELRKVIPQFLKRVDLPDRGVRHGEYLAANRKGLADIAGRWSDGSENGQRVHLVRSEENAEFTVAAAALYPHSDLTMNQIVADLRRRGDEAVDEVFAALVGDRSANRRHRPGRAFEYADYEFDICSDYGAFRDLQRHRMLTMDWQPLSPALGYDVPQLIIDAGLESNYRDQMDETYEMFDLLSERINPSEARYVVPLGFKIRYSIKGNARALMHMLELRTIPQAHPSYRTVAQEMFMAIRGTKGHQRIAAAMSHVQLGDDPELVRLESEKKLAEKRREV